MNIGRHGAFKSSFYFTTTKIFAVSNEYTLEIKNRLITDPVIGRFLGNGNIMDMGFLKAGSGDADKAAILLHIGNGCAAGLSQS
jgi:hypothetical protein